MQRGPVIGRFLHLRDSFELWAESYAVGGPFPSLSFRRVAWCLSNSLLRTLSLGYPGFSGLQSSWSFLTVPLQAWAPHRRGTQTPVALAPSSGGQASASAALVGSPGLAQTRLCTCPGSPKHRRSSPCTPPRGTMQGSKLCPCPCRRHHSLSMEPSRFPEDLNAPQEAINRQDALTSWAFANPIIDSAVHWPFLSS